MKFSLTIVSLIAAVSASTTCGNTYYSDSDVQNAADTAYSYESEGTEVSDYPHQYNNYEGFSFPVSGPYYEFPIMSGGEYDGGSPGPDRVVINGDGDLAGVITHTGASGNDFVGCSGTD